MGLLRVENINLHMAIIFPKIFRFISRLLSSVHAYYPFERIKNENKFWRIKIIIKHLINIFHLERILKKYLEKKLVLVSKKNLWYFRKMSNKKFKFKLRFFHISWNLRNFLKNTIQSNMKKRSEVNIFNCKLMILFWKISWKNANVN